MLFTTCILSANNNNNNNNIRSIGLVFGQHKILSPNKFQEKKTAGTKKIVRKNIGSNKN